MVEYYIYHQFGIKRHFAQLQQRIKMTNLVLDNAIKERIHPTKMTSTSRSISRSVVWKNGHDKHFRSVRGENGFDSLLNHEGWCGHKEEELFFDYFRMMRGLCTVIGCDCSRFCH